MSVTDEGNTEDLIAQLLDVDNRFRRDAAQRLAEVGPSGVRALVDLLLDESQPVEARGLAIEPLLEAGNVQGVQAAMRVLDREEEDEQLRRAIVFNAGKFKIEAATDLLISMLSRSETTSRIRATIATALGYIGSPRTVPVLVALLTDEGFQDDRRLARVRDAALGALVHMGAQEAVRHLIPMLAARDEQWQGRVAEALSHLGPGAVEPLRQASRSPDARLQEGAMLALERLGKVRSAIPDRAHRRLGSGQDS